MTDDELKAAYADNLARREDEDPARCVDPEALGRLAAGTASPAERLDIMDHVASCPSCMKELALIRVVAGRVENARQPRAVWALLAAAVAVVALGASLWYGVLSRAPNPMRGDDATVVLVAPIGGVSAARAHELVWHATPDAFRYTVEIVDGTGAFLYSAGMPDTVATVPANVVFTAGKEYFWSVTAVGRDGRRIRSISQPFRITR